MNESNDKILKIVVNEKLLNRHMIAIETFNWNQFFFSNSNLPSSLTADHWAFCWMCVYFFGSLEHNNNNNEKRILFYKSKKMKCLQLQYSLSVAERHRVFSINGDKLYKHVHFWDWRDQETKEN